MSPAKKDLTLYKGDSFQLFFRVRTKVADAVTGRSVPGPCKNLTGMKAVAEIKAGPGSPTSLASFKCTIPDQSIDTNLGCILLSLSPADTAKLAPSPMFPAPSYVYDVRVSSEDGSFSRTYLKGGIAVEENVS